MLWQLKTPGISKSWQTQGENAVAVKTSRKRELEVGGAENTQALRQKKA